MIIGTAGHIDHGKSTLVTALTGRPMDRLAEERRREITIDLNFAPLELGGRIAGIVDVPGHEDFVRTMVAGASGIDLALLVIAADEGIMPQTEEHLLILEQLGVPAAIPVITKADLVEPDWLDLVSLEVAERIQSSPIVFESPVAVSARTGSGMDTLRQRLATAMRSSTRSSVSDGFRMPVDRVFSLAGVGTVVTGTPWTGRLLIGDAVLVLPLGLRGRVRSLESYGRPAERAEPAVRTAVGLSGIDRAQLSRGAVVVTDELPWASGTALDVEIALDRRIKRPLSSRTRVRVLLGTEEVMARVYPRSPIEPGTRSMARLKLETPLVGRSEDRFVLRSYSPVTTIGGGRVVDPLPPRKRADWPAGLASRDPAERLQGLVERRPGGIDSAQLPLLLGVPPRVAGEVARRAPGLRLLGHLWTPTSLIESVGARALGLLRSYHREHPSSPGMPLETLRHSLKASEVVIEAALADYAQAGKLRRSDSLVTLAGFVPRVVGGDVEIDRIVGILSSAHLTPPSVAELERSTGHRDLHPLLRLAAASGRIEAVERDRYYTREALEQFALVLTDLGRAGAILPAAVRDRLGLSRKFVIPLLEWADGRGITVREGDGRRLRQKVRAGTDLP
jgi:selenocysteine-specific elongation factor